MKKIGTLLTKLTAFLMILGCVVGYMNIDAIAASNPESKKGIQGIEYLNSTDGEELGVNHVLLNMELSECIYTGDAGYPVYYEGTPYYYNYYANHYMETVKALNQKGVKVTMVLLMPWSNDSKIQKLIYSGARQSGHTFYALNMNDAASKKQIEALFDFLTKQYGSKDCHVDNWIIGNEVNMPNAYNYTGTLDIDTNVQICVDSYIALYDALQRNNPSAKAYISLDHSWTHNDEGRGIAAKTFLDRFNQKIGAKRPGANWNIAFHPYPAIMDVTAHTYNSAVKYQETLLWNNRYTPNNVNAAFVSTANLTVLTDYVKQNFGADKRIILSEVGYDARYSADNQAASTAFAFYAGQFNDMVDAVIIRAYKDDVNDGAFKLGLKDVTGQKRSSYDVFKYMDTAKAKDYADKYFNIMGISSWNEFFPAYSYSVLSGQPSYGADGFVEKDGVWYCIYNDAIAWNYTGLWSDPTVGWWYVENGVINFNYNGLVEHNGAWWCVAGGRVAFEYTGLWSDPTVGWWYVENGAINFNYNGLIEYNGAWWCVAGGNVAFGYTGLWSDPIVGWWFVQNGTINFEYNGLVEYGGAWWCVAGGNVAFTYTGLWYDQNVGWWYVENGAINFGYSGSVPYNGNDYNVVNGQVVF